MFNNRAAASEATPWVEQPAVPPVTFLTRDGPLVQHNIQVLHVPRWQSGSVDAWNKANSALFVSTVLFTSVPQSRVYKADFQRDKHVCRHNPVLLVWIRDWGVLGSCHPLRHKSQQEYWPRRRVSPEQGVFTKNIERLRNCEYPKSSSIMSRLIDRWKFTDAASVLHVVAAWERCDATVVRSVGKYSPVDTEEY